MCRNIFNIYYVTYECIEAYKILWQLLHILCQLTFLYVGSNEPPQNLLFENASDPTLMNSQLTNFQKYELTLTSSSVFYRFGPALEAIWNVGNGQKISCLLPQIEPRFLNHPACSLWLYSLYYPSSCHYEYTCTTASTTSMHHSKYCAKTGNAWS